MAEGSYSAKNTYSLADSRQSSAVRKGAFQADFRPATLAQRQLQQAIDASPRVAQLQQSAGAVIQRNRDEDVPEYAKKVETESRRHIPRAANQEVDIKADPEATGRCMVARHMNKSVLHGDHGKFTRFGNVSEVLKTATAAKHYQGGMCNEYSAVNFESHMKSPSFSQEPIVRYWNPTIGHSFTAVGDERDPTKTPFVADGWTIDRKPGYLHNSVLVPGLRDADNQVATSWTGRMPKEGAQIVKDKTPGFLKSLKDADKKSAIVNKKKDLMAEGAKKQRHNLALVDADKKSNIYDHRSNFEDEAMRFALPESEEEEEEEDEEEDEVMEEEAMDEEEEEEEEEEVRRSTRSSIRRI
jgi:hypothetical protein